MTQQIRDQNDSFANIPPRNGLTDNRYAWQSAATGAAAASANLWSGYAASELPQGKVWMEFEAEVTVAHIRLTRTATTATTVNNGTAVNFAAGSRRVCFMVDRTVDLFLDHIATGVGSIKWRMCSAEIIRDRQ